MQKCLVSITGCVELRVMVQMLTKPVHVCKYCIRFSPLSHALQLLTENINIKYAKCCLLRNCITLHSICNNRDCISFTDSYFYIFLYNYKCEESYV